jgi:hypothetical protein
MASKSSIGLAPASWAAAVDPADVPMVSSGVATSSPASKRPATTPMSHALPVEPPPPRTNARCLLGGCWTAEPDSTWDWTVPARPDAAVELLLKGEDEEVFK